MRLGIEVRCSGYHRLALVRAEALCPIADIRRVDGCDFLMGTGSFDRLSHHVSVSSSTAAYKCLPVVRLREIKTSFPGSTISWHRTTLRNSSVILEASVTYRAPCEAHTATIQEASITLGECDDGIVLYNNPSGFVPLDPTRPGRENQPLFAVPPRRLEDNICTSTNKN